jgi:uncharacterized protein YndB with AHSA1/START domain
MEPRLLESGPEAAVVAVDAPGLSPDEAYRAFTEPASLVRWWPPEAETDPRVGGTYHLSWPAMGWHLRGRYTRMEPGRALGFTWNWDHEPDLSERQVDVSFEPLPDGGTRITVVHGRYGEGDAEAADRQGHVDGWQHFLARLASDDGG